MQPVRGKIVFITGASSGIGAATALTFAQQGARLLLCARRLEKLEALRDELTTAGAEAIHFFQLDVRDRTSVNDAIASLPEEWKAVDVLVNNAGLARGMEKLYENDPNDWDEMIDTNVKGLLYVTKAIVPGMVARNSGHVVNMGSTASYNTYANGGVYCASKAAEKVISEGLKIDLLGTAVRVTSIDPGMVETDFSKVRFHGDEEAAAKVYQNITPLTGEDIADAILWAVTRPAHVNIHSMVLTTIHQGNAYYLHRTNGNATR
ncbi:SDR family NAD(P)-dependent oxidoreductase [Terriglobus tenax]|uniref:SDR family NAD(P)-dependent oxidoreductase n=1 Tax=Terriglobus tenax TaxID=1111115 RepID=UPI0021DF829D|nr:SDR family NAD(P)-dependent oxidoreductase [Terriglobus tenax]